METLDVSNSLTPLFSKLHRALGVWLWVFVLALVFSFLSPYFLTTRNLINIGRQASVFALMASGMTLVIITGGIDLSVGSVVSLSSAILGVTWRETGSLTAAIVAALLVGSLTGLIIGVLVGYVKIPPFIASFGMLGVGAGLAFAVTPTSIGDFPVSFEYLGNGYIFVIPASVVLAIAVGCVLGYVLFKTPFGLHLFAIGGNEPASKLAGIDIALHKMIAYLLNGFLASLSAVVFCSRFRSSYPGVGKDLELDVIAMAVIGGASLVGGRGGIGGALGGAVFVIMIQNVFNLLGVYPFMQKVITGLVIVIAVIMYQGSGQSSNRVPNRAKAAGARAK